MCRMATSGSEPERSPAHLPSRQTCAPAADAVMPAVTTAVGAAHGKLIEMVKRPRQAAGSLPHQPIACEARNDPPADENDQHQYRSEAHVQAIRGSRGVKELRVRNRIAGEQHRQ